MRIGSKVIGLVGAGLFAVAPAHAVAFTQAQLQAAQNGLQAMRELNVITFGNLNSNSSEVEGKTFVGGNLSGGNYGIGNGTDKQTASSRQVLTVGGNLTGSVTINNGQNGSSGNIIGSAAQNVVRVGGSSTGEVNMNSATSNLSGKIQTGGSFNNQNFNPNSTKRAEYGTSASNVQAQDQAYVTQNTSLANSQTGLAATIMGEANALKSNLQTLSNVLGNLSTNASLNLSDRNNIILNYTSAAQSADFVVVNVNASDLFNGGGTLNLSLLSSATSGTGYKTTVINVLNMGTGSYNYSINNNDTQNSNDQNIIWNFGNTASNISLSTAFHGSVLATGATLSNSTMIEGSVVTSVFNQGGEVHLGTYNGTSNIVTSQAAGPVPEPETWAMMMIGFAAIGSLVRRQKQLGVLVRI